MKKKVIWGISLTYIYYRKKQNIIAALGVVFGMSIFIFLNSMITGTNQWFEKIILQNTPHIRLYNDDQLSSPKILDAYFHDHIRTLISNPQLVNSDNSINNPNSVLTFIKDQPYISAVSEQVVVPIVYQNKTISRSGSLYGVDILEQNKMYDITSTMIAGNIQALAQDNNAIILGSGVAKDLNVKIGDYVMVKNATTDVSAQLRVAGIFSTTISSIDKTKSFANINIAQNLLQKNSNYITDIVLNIKDKYQAPKMAQILKKQLGLTVEDWQTANQQSLAGTVIRNLIANSIALTILLVAGFGIYNILNMVVQDKIKEIAILKATGFQKGDIIRIFLYQASLIAVFGAILGLLLGGLICYIVGHIYVGLGALEYIPIGFHPIYYVQALLFGFITCFFAAYMPAFKASRVDPIQIIRG